MKTENIYKGFEILFHERLDEWSCEGYSNISRKKVKEWIDKTVKTKFKKFDVYLKNCWSFEDRKLVTVTSKAEGEEAYWVKDGKGRRTKESATNLFQVSIENDSLFKKISELKEASADISIAIKELEAELTSLV